MRVGYIAIIALGGCGLFPDVSGLAGDASADSSAADGGNNPGDGAGAADAADAADANDAEPDAPPDPLRVVNVWNNIDDTTTLAPTISVSITNAAGHALVACVREGTNNADQFTVTDDAAQSWVKTTSGYEQVNTSGELACFLRPSSAALATVTASFTTSGGVSKRSIIVLEIGGAASSALEDVSVNSGGVTDGVNATLVSGPLSTSTANEMLVFYVGLGDDVTAWTPGAGFTIPNNQIGPGNSGANVRTAIEARVVSAVQSGTVTSMSWSPILASGHSEMGVFMALKGK